jgi:anaerobic selenocysteine-containing dehydrogenase
MANMAWNSTMNTMAVREMLNRKRRRRRVPIPFLVVCDAFQSEMVGFADLVLPDTTYLERHDVMSMLDRPISEFEGPVDSVRVPVVEPTGDCKPFQEVLIELASRLKFPAFTREDGTRKFKDYPDFIVNFQAQPGVGFLMGWRGKDGTEHLRGEPNPKQWEMYAKNNCVFQYHMPPEQQYMRNWNQPYLDFAKDKGWRQRNDPVQLAIYSDTLQAFRLAAQGKTRGRQPPDHLRERIATYFDPLPFWYEPLENACVDTDKFPLAAITQRPMAMYHSWDSQNAWLRQIHSHNYLHVNPVTAQAAGVADGGWAGSSSAWGELRCMVRYSDAVEPGTVWTWNAIGKARRCVAPGPGRRRVAQGLPAQPPHLRGTAIRRRPHQQLGPGHGPGRLVRRAREPCAPRSPTRRRKPLRKWPPCPARLACSAPRARSSPISSPPSHEPSPRSAGNPGQATRPGHRPERLRGLPRLRHLLQGMEHLRCGWPALGPERLR